MTPISAPHETHSCNHALTVNVAHIFLVVSAKLTINKTVYCTTISRVISRSFATSAALVRRPLNLGQINAFQHHFVQRR